MALEPGENSTSILNIRTSLLLIRSAAVDPHVSHNLSPDLTEQTTEPLSNKMTKPTSPLISVKPQLNHLWGIGPRSDIAV